MSQSSIRAPARLTGEAKARSALWHIRKGLYAAVAGARPAGTTALLEDIAVPVPALAQTCQQLTGLFERHGYAGSVIFGHARDGNLHFMLTERFRADTVAQRYARFTEDMVDLVLAQGGTLKAEHGTGRVMAPFVRRQFGDELYAVMRDVKTLCDPRSMLNPGVLLTDDPQAHLRHLKAVPEIEPEVDRCVECGYCEPVCPSKDLTTTPRQRIVLRRELAAAQAAGDDDLVRELSEEYRYEAVDTCAVDGMCATACPVSINTGDLVKRLRAERTGPVTRAGWLALAQRWNGTIRAMAGGLDVAAKLPPALPRAASRVARTVLGADRVPQWQPDLPAGGSVRRPRPVARPDAVYLPSCLGTLFAPAEGGPGVAAALHTLAERAGVRLSVPEPIAGLCCGAPWSSKGLPAALSVMSDRVIAAVLAASKGGDLLVVSDAASCTEGFQRLVAAEGAAVRVVDVVEYAATVLLPRLTVTHKLGSLALHPTCSSTRLGLDDALSALATAIAEEVTVPDGWQCCAFAGDRGLLHPELTASATRQEAETVRKQQFDGYASVNRTCELGMTRATGATYHHLIELVEAATR